MVDVVVVFEDTCCCCVYIDGGELLEPRVAKVVLGKVMAEWRGGEGVVIVLSMAKFVGV